ncbi:hypothetical protein N7449_009208 [Penicillium cf. viridicatum]|uniref:Uncharacterized protein n=1 Tax=Penicillium cf. viridicatum TaxID=2972119 RepID=A0A9W9JEW6_9EURO|nr:hypothetical protein N7449_009208 [Penicillium cf. viridicatum]
MDVRQAYDSAERSNLRAREKEHTTRSLKSGTNGKHNSFRLLLFDSTLLSSLALLPALSTIGDLLDFLALCSTELPCQHNDNEATPGTVNSDCEYPERRWHSFGSMC